MHRLMPAPEDSTQADSKPEASRRPSVLARLLPINFFMGYLVFTIFLFAYGPWQYPVEDGTDLYLFLLVVHLALVLGYLTAIWHKPVDYRGPWKATTVIWASIIINLLVLLPTAALNTGSLIPDVGAAITDPGQAYANSLAGRLERAPTIAYLRIFVGPFLSMLFPLTVFYWNRLPRTARWLASFVIVGVLVTYVGMGMNKGIFDLVLCGPWIFAAACIAGRFHVTRRQWIAMGTTTAAVFILALVFFASTQSSRVGMMAVNGQVTIGGAAVDPTHFMIRDMPPNVQAGIVGLSGYLTQGYYALYLSLKEPFVPMWGVGNSMFLYRQAIRITGDQSIEDMPYPKRIEGYGWNAYGYWSSIYPWIASDVSFPGTILVIFLLGRYLALAWLDTLRGNSFLAVAVFAQFIVMLYYLPANNQCLQTGEGFSAFWVLLFAWLWTRRKAQLRPA